MSAIRAAIVVLESLREDDYEKAGQDELKELYLSSGRVTNMAIAHHQDKANEPDCRDD